MTSTPQSLIQLTDLHLFANPEQGFKGQKPWQNLLDLLAQIEQQGLPDLFLLTGDLSQDESYESYLMLYQLMERIGVSWYWIPGNHDQVDLMSKLKPVIPSVTLGAWQWLLLDSNSGEPYGKLSSSQRMQLQAALEQPEAEHIGVAIHHQPLLVGPARQGKFLVELDTLDDIAGIDSIPLQDEGWLWKTLVDCSAVKAVICGHVHQSHEIKRDGLTLYTTPATSIQFTADINAFELDMLAPGYRRFGLYNDGRVESRVERLASIV